MKEKVSVSSTIVLLAFLIFILVLIFQDYQIINVKENFIILSILYCLGGIGLLLIGAIFYLSKSTTIYKKDGRYKSGVKVIGYRASSRSEIESNQDEGRQAFKSGFTLIIFGLILLFITKVIL